jgi:penicillin-binding protein 1A
MVPNLVTGVWVGGEDRATHFENITYGQGATMALPIWANFMKRCYLVDELGISKDEFEKPEFLTIEIECNNYLDQEMNELNEIITPEIDF